MPQVPLEGRCTCGDIRYRLEAAPIMVHCCHCSYCQRESGTAFALNAMIETDRVTLLSNRPEMVVTPSNSGKGQKIIRCPSCRVALWSHYAGAGEAIAFIRVGTLEDPSRCPPDVHIFTSSRQPWVILNSGTPAFPEFYDPKTFWPAAAMQRRQSAIQRHTKG